MAVPVGFLERPSVALANLLMGDVRAAGRAIVAPDTLAPERSKTLADLVEERVGTNPLLKIAATLATDPLIILGMALSMRYAPAKLADMFKMGGRWDIRNKGVGMIEGKIMRPEGLLMGTPLEHLLVKSNDEKLKIAQKMLDPLQEAVQRFNTATGKEFSLKEAYAAVLRIENWDGHASKAVGPKAFVQAFNGKIQVPRVLDMPEVTKASQQFTEWLQREYPKKLWDEMMTPILNSPTGKQAVLDKFGLAAGADLNKPLPNYFPHLPTKTPEGELEYFSRTFQALAADPRQFNLKQKEAILKAMGRSEFHRRGWMVIDPDELRAAGFTLNPEFDRQLADVVAHNRREMYTSLDEAAQGWAAKQAGAPSIQAGLKDWLEKAENGPWATRPGPAVNADAYTGQMKRIAGYISQGQGAEAKSELTQLIGHVTQVKTYTGNPVVAYTGYVNGLARPYAWHVEGLAKDVLGHNRGIGPTVLDETAKLPDSGKVLMNDLIPILQGRTNEQQTKNLMKWAQTRMSALDWLQNPERASRFLPAKWRSWLTEKLTAEQGPFTYLNASNNVAGWFYFSTIAGNPASAFKNLLQTVLTTMPLLGPTATGKGISSTVSKMGKYYDLRYGAQKLDEAEAMMKAFPEFSKVPHLGGAYTMSQQMLHGALEEAWRNAAKNLPPSLARFGAQASNQTLEAIKKSAMWMFTQSELFNRHVAFEGALWKGVNEGLQLTEAVPLAAKVVRASQFASAPGQMPHGLLNVASPWRQFMYFPARYLGFLWESTRQGVGPMTAAGTPAWSTLGGARQWGTIGRGIAGTAAAASLGKNLLGMDLSGGLMTGALPAPGIPGTPLYPLPVVPPIISVPALAIQAAATQDTEPLGRAASLLMPMGVPLSRLYRSGVLPQMGIPLGKQFADWDKRDAQGRVPVMDGAGKLVAYRRPLDIYLKAAGIQVEDTVKEREMVSYLLRHRDNIRDIRRSYVDAVYDNNPEDAEKIQETFKRQYPQLGELQVKKADLTAAEKRRELSRLQRLMQTFPAEYRQEFQNVVGAAMSAETMNQFPQQQPPAPMMNSAPFQQLMQQLEQPDNPFDYESTPGLGGVPYPGNAAFSLNPHF